MATGIAAPVRTRTIHTRQGTAITFTVGVSGSAPGQQMRGASLEERFASRTQVEDRGYETPCLIFTGHVDKDGYGRFYDASRKKTVGAHRWSFEASIRPLGTDEVPDHKCKVRSFVEPSHLEAVPHGENSRRGRQSISQGREGRCRHGHTDLKVDKRGHQVCRECQRISSRAYNARKQAEKSVVTQSSVDLNKEEVG